MRRQTETLQAAMEEASTIASEAMVASTPEAKTAKQVEVVQASLQTALSNMKEVADTVDRSNTEVANVISKRVSESPITTNYSQTPS